MKNNIDHEYTKEIVCPYCGNEQSDSWEFSDDGEIECGMCEETFTYERIVTVEYSTAKSECKEHNYILRKDLPKLLIDTKGVFDPKYRREPIPQSEWTYYRLVKCTICDKETQQQISIDEYNLI